jgi:hypothetical protein
MGKYDNDIRRWKSIISQNRRRIRDLFSQRHTEAAPALGEVRSQVSFLRYQSQRLLKFVKDYQRRDRSITAQAPNLRERARNSG